MTQWVVGQKANQRFVHGINGSPMKQPVKDLTEEKTFIDLVLSNPQDLAQCLSQHTQIQDPFIYTQHTEIQQIIRGKVHCSIT